MTNPRSVIFSAVGMALALAVPCQADPIPAGFMFTVYRFAQNDGSAQFHLIVSSAQLQATIHFPNGTSAPGLGFTDLTYNSFADFHSAAEGNWSITFPAIPSLNRPAEDYTVSVADFPESVVSSLPPSIISPINGASVSPQFTVTWEWPTGVGPPSNVVVNFQLYKSGNFYGWKTSNFSNVISSQVVTPEIPGAAEPDETIVRVGTNESSLTPYISAVSSDQSSPHYAFRVTNTVSSFSLPVDLKVAVPEPTTATLLLLGMLGCGWPRR